MNPAIWIAIYMPLFVLFFVIRPSQRRNQALMLKKRRMKEGVQSWAMSF